MKPKTEDMFSDAKAYEVYIGRWSRLVAQQFIDWLDIAAGQMWLDVGAGTGILSSIILERVSPARVVGVDLSPGYIAFARRRSHDDRVEFRVGDAANIAYEMPLFDVSVAGLVLNFLPEPPQVVKGMTQVVKSGGIVAGYVWDYGGQMEMMRHFWDAASKIDPASRGMDAGQRFALCEPNNLRSLFESAGLTAVDVIPIDIQTRFKDFDDYWLPFLGAQGSVSKYLRGLNDDTRTALRSQLLTQLPIMEDGHIALVARAWAVKGEKAS